MKIRSIYISILIVLLVSLAGSPASALTWNTTPTKVTFVNGQNLTLTGWLFKPAGNGPFPAVVMMHGCNGVYSYSDPTKGLANQYREWGDRLTGAGYIALLVDSFTPRKVAQNECNSANGVSEVTDRPYDAVAGLKYLTERSDIFTDRIGLLGWSHGGSATMMTMDVSKYGTSNNFKAAVAFYPGCGLYNALGGLENSTWKPYAPFALLIGSADTVVSVDYCKTRVSKAQALGASSTTITVYAKATHSFDGATKVTSTFTQADVDGGPVEISGPSGSKIIASLNQWRRRVGTTEWTGVSQSMALPVGNLSNVYVMPRYDYTNPTRLYNTVLLANVDTVARDITVTIGGNMMGTYTLGPSESQYKTYSGIAGGPVVVSSDTGAQIIASIYELRRDPRLAGWNGQSEMMGLPWEQLSDQYVIPIYFGVASINTLDARLFIGVP
jgi:dienelactone hydrolase